jgi:hypothetical protein
MDTPELDVKYMPAGRDYLAAIRMLGLDPDALLWAYDKVMAKHVLVLVTDMFDFRGPYEVSELLFAAYNKAGTPREIDPFIIRLHSPKHTIVPQLLEFANAETVQKRNKETNQPEGDPIPVKEIDVGGGLVVRKAWVYVIRPQRSQKVVELARRWARFQRNVEKLAA